MLENLRDWLKKASVEVILGKVSEEWETEFMELDNVPAIEKYLNSTFVLDLISYNKNTLQVLVDVKTFKILYLSENLEDFSGYSMEEFKQKNMLFFFEVLTREHLLFFFHFIRWWNKVRKVVSPQSLLEAVTFQWVGLRTRPKMGHPLRLLFKIYPLEKNQKGLSRLAFITIENISHLMKGDGYWCRMEAGKKPVLHSSFFSGSYKFPMLDVLSDREKEVLRLVAQGRESKEISEKLFISVSTVEKHRKNMIARLGARDSSALLEICRMCNMI